MSGITIGIYILMIAAIVAAIFALEYKNLMVSVISLIAMNLFVWGVLLIFDAILLAWVQLIVYGGGLTALFIVVVALTERQLDETFDWRRTVIALSVIAIIVGVLIWAIIAYDITSITATWSEGIFSNMWEERTPDIILQGIIFFTTSIAIGVLFLQHKKKKVKEETKA
ncbi:MAG: NADH-quinone oxidoreductase subunit J [Candidatus Thorarchaeota archaeon]